MAILNPYLQFSGNAREAMESYRDVFGGELDVTTFGSMGAEQSEHAPPADGVMHAQLKTDEGFTLMGSDLPASMGEPHNGSVSLSGTEDALLRGYWDKLSDGAQVEMPLEKQMWGDVFGSCTDRFGINWMVNITQEQ